MAKTSGTLMNDKGDEAGRRKVLTLISGIDYALLTTHARGGAAFHARPMAYRSVDDDGDVWFFTKGDSRKVEDLRADPATLVTFADPHKQHFVTITGESEIVADPAEKKHRWTELYRTWFPGGPEDDAVVLIRVRASSAEYWDAPTSAMVYAYGYMKALVTGKPARSGEIGKVELT